MTSRPRLTSITQQRRQELQVNDLKRYGIIGLLVDDYAHYTEVLRRIAHRYKMARVFMSGSAAEYAPWEPSKAQELIQELSPPSRCRRIRHRVRLWRRRRSLRGQRHPGAA